MSMDTLIKRIAAMRAMTDPKSPEMRTALTRIATVLQAEMRLNIGRQKIIDQGGLLNSIKYELTETGVDVGSYGIKYAAINEYGGPMTHQQVAAMFAALRKRSGKVKLPGKGIVTVKNGTGYWRARPYIRPALVKHKDFIIEMIRTVGKP